MTMGTVVWGGHHTFTADGAGTGYVQRCVGATGTVFLVAVAKVGAGLGVSLLLGRLRRKALTRHLLHPWAVPGQVIVALTMQAVMWTL
jgi:hypothetical protein